MQRQPKVLRFVLSDLSDRQATMKCVGTAHQFLSKPCDPRVLAAALERALAYENWLPGEKVRGLLARLHKLPSPPQLYFEVVKALQSPDASLETVGALIARDPAMTAKILQLVNSAVFGLKRTVASPAEAVMYLGIDTTKSVILLAHSFSYFDQVKDTGFSVENLWRHSIRTGNFARWIAGAEGVDQAQVEEAYTAGMLHDLGKLALAANLPRQYSEAAMLAASRNLPLWEAEEQALGANHAELGASMLAIWGLPVAIIEAVALHHQPGILSLDRGTCGQRHRARRIFRGQQATRGCRLPSPARPGSTASRLVGGVPAAGKAGGGRVRGMAWLPGGPRAANSLEGLSFHQSTISITMR
jgi:putative nucleotidyltransferase with HDIG domain